MAYQSLLKQVLPKARDYFEVRVCKNDKNKYDKLMDAYALGVQQPHKQSEAWDIIKDYKPPPSRVGYIQNSFMGIFS